MDGWLILARMNLSVHISALATDRGITTAYQLWQRIGGSQESAAQLWKGEFKMIRLETMVKLCALLECQPGDLFTLEEGRTAKRRGKSKKEA